jgi:alpha-L-fucosidase 2
MLRMTQNLVKPGTRTAQAYFGPDTPGWVVGYTTNGWSWTSPGERLNWGVWFGGSAWMCQHLWEHYAYGRDKDYLRSVYPTLKGAADFWMSQLVEGSDGMLITSPSSSPENEFVTEKGVRGAICEGATMEKSLVRDLLTNTAKHLARDIATFNRFLRNKNSILRGSSSPLDVAIEINTTSASCP